jgi:hypothetical protein
MPRAIPLSDYTPAKIRVTRVFKLDAAPKSSPIDINLAALLQESGWNLSDRLRFWHTLGDTVPQAGLTIRTLDLDEKALAHCNVETSGSLSILSNSREYATWFFRTVFLNCPPRFASARDWNVTSAELTIRQASSWGYDRVESSARAGALPVQVQVSAVSDGLPEAVGSGLDSLN